MKILLILILFLVTKNTFSQQSVSEMLWVGDNNEYFLADSNTIRFETFSNRFGNIRIAKAYFIKGDTLKVIENEVKNQTFTSDFLINTVHKNSMTLTPINELANNLTNQITLTGAKKKLNFIEINQIYTDTIQFEKIVFNSTTCYGTCPNSTIQIDKKKQVQFFGGEYAIKQGMFRSKVTDAQFSQLIEILKTSELGKIVSNKYTNIDAPTHTIEIYYNNKIKRLKSCMLPFATDRLLAYLLNLPKNIELTESTEPLDVDLIMD